MIVLDVDWYSSGVKPVDILSGKTAPDLSLGALALGRGSEPKLHILYDTQTEKFSVEGGTKQPFKAADNGKITSILDIPGSTIVIRPRLNGPLVLMDATLSFGQGRSFDIPAFRRVVANRVEAYLFEFPKDADLTKLSERQIVKEYKVRPIE
jgi:hypothetical protein